MKKWYVLFTSVLLVAALLGCAPERSSHSYESPEGGQSLREGKTLSEVAEQIATELEVPMPGYIHPDTLCELLGVKQELIQDCAGILSMDINSGDNIVAVQAGQDSAGKVKAALEKRLEDVRLAYSELLPAQYNKAESGKIVENGNYLFLIVVGRQGKDAHEEVQKAEDIIAAFFE